MDILRHKFHLKDNQIQVNKLYKCYLVGIANNY